jgi:hypothetical protein
MEVPRVHHQALVHEANQDLFTLPGHVPLKPSACTGAFWASICHSKAEHVRFHSSG